MASKTKPSFSTLKYIASLARKHKIVVGCLAAALGGGILSQDMGHISLNLLYSRTPQVYYESQGPEYIGLPPGVTYDYIVDDYPEAKRTSWFRRRKHGEKFMHWKLLQLSRSKSRQVRHLTLKALTELPGMTDAEYREIAQASDFNSCVGLARIKGTDSRFFLPPPSVPEEMGIDHVENELQRLLLYMPEQESDPCLQIFTATALKSARGDEQYGDQVLNNQMEMVGLEEVLPPQVPRREASVVLCLQALLRHSTHQDSHLVMVQHGLLPLLHRVRGQWPNRTEFQCLMGQIIGNLALNSEMHRYIFSSGWIGVLASWFSDGLTLDVSLPAARALANLDGDNAFQEAYSDGVYPLYPLQRYRDENLQADIVLVHGLLGGAFKTWRQHDSCGATKNYSNSWPKDWLSADLPNCRIIAVDYDTQLSDWSKKCPFDERSRSLSSRSDKLMTKLLESGVGDRPIIWVTHSMGGLLVKKLLLKSWDSNDERLGRLVEQTRGLVFCSVPHKGSSLANLKPTLQYLFLPSAEVKELKDTPQMENEHAKLLSILRDNDVKCLSFGETLRTVVGFRWTVLVVPPKSADPDIGDYYSLEVNHLDSCKPKNRMSPFYSRLLAFICSCLYSQEETDRILKQESQVRPIEIALTTSFS